MKYKNTTNISDSSSMFNETMSTDKYSGGISGGDLYFYGSIVVVAFGFPGNTFALASMLARRLDKKSAVFIFFAWIAAIDLSFMVCGPFESLLKYLIPMPEATKDLLCRVSSFGSHGSLIASPWLLVALYIYKLYGISRPLHLKSVESTRTSLLICLVITFLAFAYSLHKAFTYIFIPSSTGLHYCFVNPVWSTFGTIELFIGACFYFVLPGIGLIGLSAAILISFTISYRRHVALLTKNMPADEAEKIIARDATFITAKRSIYAMLPAAVLHIVSAIPTYTVLFADFKTYNDGMVFPFLRSTLNLNHAWPFYIQMLSSKFYRYALLGRDLDKQVQQQ